MILLLATLPLRAQNDTLTRRDSIAYYYWLQDSAKKDSAGKLIFYQVGGFISDGNTQYFEGFNQRVLYNNASAGLPIYSDWEVYSNQVLIPKFFKAGAYVSFMDTVRKLKVRVGGYYYHRKDTMAYVSGFAINDTIFGRQAYEQAGFAGVSLSGMKTSRKLFKTLRLYGGAMLELSFASGSKIDYLEYSYDYGDERIIELNIFNTNGKPRMDGYLSAILGLETYFFNRVGFTFEVRSGVGLHVILKEPAVGISKTVVAGGLNYYLKGL